MPLTQNEFDSINTTMGEFNELLVAREGWGLEYSGFTVNVSRDDPDAEDNGQSLGTISQKWVDTDDETVWGLVFTPAHETWAGQAATANIPAKEMPRTSVLPC